MAQSFRASGKKRYGSGESNRMDISVGEPTSQLVADRIRTGCAVETHISRMVPEHTSPKRDRDRSR